RNISARDCWIGWRGAKGITAKKARLNHIVDLSVCLAVPPYNHFLAGKLVALCALSNELRSFFGKKYRASNPTVLLITTAIFGNHASVYNRLRFGGIR